jgi:hypothetical protein
MKSASATRTLLPTWTRLVYLLFSCVLFAACDFRTGSASADPPPGGGSGLGSAESVDPNRPQGAPVGIRHDLPRAPDNLSNRGTWLSTFAERCEEAGQPEDCLTVEFEFYEVGYPDYDKRTVLEDPGDEFDQERWEGCSLVEIDPPTGDSEVIDSGSTVTLTVTCERVYDGTGDDEGDQQGDADGQSGDDGGAQDGAGDDGAADGDQGDGGDDGQGAADEDTGRTDQDGGEAEAGETGSTGGEQR